MSLKQPAETVVSNVRAEMARRSQTQSGLASKIGMRQQALSRRLSGRTPFTVNELARIAAALDCPLGDLITAEASA